MNSDMQNTTQKTILKYQIRVIVIFRVGPTSFGLNRRWGWDRVIVFNTTFNNIFFSAIVKVSFIGGENRSIRRKPPTCRKSLTHIKLYRIEYASPSLGIELTTFVVIGIDCTGSCKSSYHTITTTTDPIYYINNNV